MNKKTLYLHIGTFKTGSTSIQNWLKINKAPLMADGFYYPTEGSYFHAAAQGLLAHSIRGKRPNYIGKKVVFSRESCVSDMRRDIKNNPNSNCIVSTEHFSHLDSKHQWVDVREIFSDLFDNIFLILYVRRQDFYLESAYNQLVKSGEEMSSFDEFVENSAAGQNHFEKLELISSVFDKKNIIVRPYERGQFVDENVVADFRQTIGLPAYQVAPSEANESVPVEVLEAIRLFNLGVSPLSARKHIALLLRRAPIKFDKTNYTVCPDELRASILDRYRESNSQVAKCYLGREDGQLFFESECSPKPLYPGMRAERLGEIAAMLCLLQSNALFNLKKSLQRVRAQTR